MRMYDIYVRRYFISDKQGSTFVHVRRYDKIKYIDTYEIITLQRCTSVQYVYSTCLYYCRPKKYVRKYTEVRNTTYVLPEIKTSIFELIT